MKHPVFPNFRQVRKVLWQVLFMNLFVALLKISLGLFSGLLSMVADGFHSLMDSASNIVGLVALRIAQVPPDPEHPYGHRKAETLASLFIGVLLVLAAYEIFTNAFERLMTGSAPQVTPISFGVMLATILINLLTTVYEQRRGKALNSEILLTDAVHTRTDIGVSLAVMAGLVGMRLGWAGLDALVGMGIAGLIGYSAIQVLRRSANVLMDRAALPEQEIEKLALTMPGVESVERIRSRGRVDETYLDLHVRVKPDMPTACAHSIAHAVQDRIKESFPQAADITVHIEPEQASHPADADIIGQLKAIAQSLGLDAHEIWLYTVAGRYFVDLHLEVPAQLSLAEAHDLATQLEKRGQNALPDIGPITTHIEPMGEMVKTSLQLEAETAARLKAQARRIADDICGLGASHNLRLWPEPGALALSMHCTLPPAISIIDAHTLSEQVRDALRQQMPELKRVTVHVEPPPSRQYLALHRVQPR